MIQVPIGVPWRARYETNLNTPDHLKYPAKGVNFLRCMKIARLDSWVERDQKMTST